MNTEKSKNVYYSLFYIVQYAMYIEDRLKINKHQKD